jgi:hypothetical protein
LVDLERLLQERFGFGVIARLDIERRQAKFRLDLDTDMQTIRNYVSGVVESKTKVMIAYTGAREPYSPPSNSSSLLVRLRPLSPDRVIVDSLPVRFNYPEKTLKGGRC